MITTESQETAPRPRQLRLLEVGNPLSTRLGAGFFQTLPRQPGVYFFYDAQDRLLYIGQSNDLRARVGSYRHVCPERHPRRTLRLVHRIARVETNLCSTHAEAKQLEATLLLERRPPFNRAGVWQGPPWWLLLHRQESTLHIRLARAPSPDHSSLGPLDSSFRYVHAALIRCLLRSLDPSLTMGGFPVGLLNLTAPLALRLSLPAESPELTAKIGAFATRAEDTLLNHFETLLTPENISGPLEQIFWAEQIETLRKYYAKQSPVSPTPTLPASPGGDSLPLFPLWSGW